jgi:hypothetical protein
MASFGIKEVMESPRGGSVLSSWAIPASLLEKAVLGKVAEVRIVVPRAVYTLEVPQNIPSCLLSLELVNTDTRGLATNLEAIPVGEVEFRDACTASKCCIFSANELKYARGIVLSRI